MKSKGYFFFILIFFLMTSCQKEKTRGNDTLITQDIDISTIRIPASQIPLFANMEDYNLLSRETETRAPKQTPTFPLESLLDLQARKIALFKNARMTQIPFLQNSEGTVMASIGDSPDENVDEATCVKKFYITSSNDEYTGAFVVTMITDYHYYQTHSDFDYLNMPNYTGAVLYSTVEGQFMEARIYKGGLIQPAEPLENITGEALYILLYENLPETRGPIDGGYINASVCIGLAVKPDWLDPSWCFGQVAGKRGRGNTPVSGGGSGGNGNDQQSADSVGDMLLPNLPPISIDYEVKLSTNIPEYVNMLGAGKYASGTSVAIDYELTALIYQEPVFSHWTGSFENYEDPTFVFILTKDVESTAYFESDIPCTDLEKGVTNPLKVMRIAATSSGRYIGGTFGKVRYDKYGRLTRYHQGVDFYAEEGTPVYAMYPGIITRIVSDLPVFYSTEKTGGFGNIIVVESQVAITEEMQDCKTLSLQYSHLQYNNAVAINPRTGCLYQVGDKVFRGDLIGYTGRTGNAANVSEVPFPHLHLGASFEGKYGSIPRSSWVDPMLFINGTIDMENIQTKKGIVENIKCD